MKTAIKIFLAFLSFQNRRSKTFHTTLVQTHNIITNQIWHFEFQGRRIAGIKRKRVESSRLGRNGKRRKIIKKSRLPSYKVLLKEKKKCRLDPEDVFVSDNEVRASLQKMLDLTVRRLMLDPKIVSKLFDIQNKFGNVRLEFIYKLGN